MQPKVTAHVVSHTHWDREWYQSFQQFRIRLVALLDELLNIFEKEPEYRHFNLDGQTICLEDYLEVRPHQRERLAELVSSGKIAVGPWYVLPDGFLTGSEALIRNLLIGDEIAGSFGRKMQVGYLPDTFGHCSQIPQIMAKFGMKAVLIWRGLNGEPDELKSEFLWHAPDGTELLTVHLSDDFGYFNVPMLPTEPEQAMEVLQATAEERREYAVCSQILLMNGFDHFIPQYHTGRILASVNTQQEDTRFVHSGIEAYVDAVLGEKPSLQVLAGEFTSTNRSTRGKVNAVLRNVLSSRMYLKQRDYEADRLLVRYAEPLMVQAWLQQGGYDRDILKVAWKYLVKNHPHDSVCGCSIDSVHREMEQRYQWVEDIAQTCITGAMSRITKQVDTSCFEDNVIPIHLFNTLPYEREANAMEIELNLSPEQHFRSIAVLDGDGRQLTAQIVQVEETVKMLENQNRSLETKLTKRVKVLADGGRLPAMGYCTLGAKLSPKPAFDHHTLSAAPNCMENEFLQVDIQPNGTMNIRDKVSGRKVEKILYFIDGGDVGDEYVYSPPMVDSVLNTMGAGAAVSLENNGPLMAKYRITQVMMVPEGAEEKGYARSSHTVQNVIHTDVILRKGSRKVEFETTIENHAKDHRIRVCLPTGVISDQVQVDSHFDVVTRPVEVEQPAVKAWLENATAAGAQKRFFCVADELGGVAVLNQGIPEYEVTHENGRCTAMLTLLRCVDRIGSNRSMTVGMEPGPQNRTPDAQCIGTYTFRYAVMLFAGTWEEAGINYEAETYSVPVLCAMNTIHPGNLPLQAGGLKLDNPHMAVSAIKKAEDREALILRLYSLSDKTETVEVSGFPLQEAYIANLKEERIRRLENSQESVRLEVKAREIVTLELVGR